VTQTGLHSAFTPFKRLLPRWLANVVRSLGTATIGPVRAAYRSGFYRSAFARAAVTKSGEPLPWYTYPSIDFLGYRDYSDRTVLEFGGGQSTLWWARRARQVVTLEGDPGWYSEIKQRMPANASLHLVSMASRDENVADVRRALEAQPQSTFDVIVIDGLYRENMIDFAQQYLSDDGIIVCDNAEGYGFHEGFKDSGLWRVDFFGNAPGVVLPHATSVYFRPHASFVFDAGYPIPVVAKGP
jgi:hypothetical protein